MKSHIESVAPETQFDLGHSNIADKFGRMSDIKLEVGHSGLLCVVEDSRLDVELDLFQFLSSVGFFVVSMEVTDHSGVVPVDAVVKQIDIEVTIPCATLKLIDICSFSVWVPCIILLSQINLCSGHVLRVKHQKEVDFGFGVIFIVLHIFPIYIDVSLGVFGVPQTGH